MAPSSSTSSLPQPPSLDQPLTLGDRVRFLLQEARILGEEVFQGFLRNDGLRQASSLAFYTALALLPALLLLTNILGVGIGSSHKAMQKVGEFLGQVIPQFSGVILGEVEILAKQRRMAGVLNLMVLLWAVSPLVATLRAVVGDIFRVRTTRPFWATKLLDLLMVVVVLSGLALVAGLGVILKVLKGHVPGLVVPTWLGILLPFSLTVVLLMGLFYAFLPRVKASHLMAGALVTTLLWMVLKPAFNLFLAFNPGYGMTFGSFKSVFIVVIWIYYSQAVLMVGAEVIAAFHRRELLLIRKVMEGGHTLPDLRHLSFIRRVEAGGTFCLEGDVSGEMFHLRHGTVAIEAGGQEVARLQAPTFIGEMSFLLEEPRSATIRAVEPCEAVVITARNLEGLMKEDPALVRSMLREMAGRLRDTSRKASGH